jgi:uncharacterized membrane protein YdjX (TVP38/TMEM64 family)
MQFWKEYKYKNLSFFLLSVLFAVWISRFEQFHEFLLHLGGFGYISIFIAGFLFVSTFTVSTGIVILLVLAELYSPLEIGPIAGLGAVFGDVVIFQFVKDKLADELHDYYDTLDGKHHLQKILHSKYFRWTPPVIGAIIIASPLPDELGVSLMGISKMKTYQFLLLSFILNAFGIFLLISASLVSKP